MTLNSIVLYDCLLFNGATVHRRSKREKDEKKIIGPKSMPEMQQVNAWIVMRHSSTPTHRYDVSHTHSLSLTLAASTFKARILLFLSRREAMSFFVGWRNSQMTCRWPKEVAAWRNQLPLGRTRGGRCLVTQSTAIWVCYSRYCTRYIPLPCTSIFLSNNERDREKKQPRIL